MICSSVRKKSSGKFDEPAAKVRRSVWRAGTISGGQFVRGNDLRARGGDGWTREVEITADGIDTSGGRHCSAAGWKTRMSIEIAFKKRRTALTTRATQPGGNCERPVARQTRCRGRITRENDNKCVNVEEEVEKIMASRLRASFAKRDKCVYVRVKKL